MKNVTMFTMASCPYCRQALKWMEELQSEHPEYAKVPITFIDEVEHPDIADKYDYYYVPTYYVDGKKVHEGAATKEKVENMYRAALED